MLEDYKFLGYDRFLEKDSSLLKGIKELQLYQTLNFTDEGEEVTDQVSSGIATINVEKLSEVEKNELIGKIKAKNIGSGDIDGILNLVMGHLQSANFETGSTGWRIDSDGNVEFDSGYFRGDITGASGTFSGTITATTGAIGGFNIGADYIRDVADSMGMASTVTGGDDVRFWAGDTFANRATASWRVTEAGALYASSATISGAITTGAGSRIDVQ